MKKNISLKIILFTFIFFIQSCGIYVQYDYDSDVNFDNYSSYSFYQPYIDELEISDLDKKRILKSLDLGLKSKGLERSNSPDLLVTFETKSKERVYVNNYLPYGWYPFAYHYPYSSGYSRVQGTLYVNLIDSKNQQLVWQGKGVGVLNEYSDNRDKMINNFGPLKVGIGGTVGAGKTSLTEALCKKLSKRISMAVISNDIYTIEDAEYLMKAQALPIERIKGVETGGCPHTAIREDASINLLAVDELKEKFPDLELILIESGGDNLAATFSPELVDLSIYVIDVGMGGDIPRKGGPAITKSDFLLVNKTDLAPHVGVDLQQMKNDVEIARNKLPFVFGQMKNNAGIDIITSFLNEQGGLSIN